MKIDYEKEELASRLRGSFLDFVQTFFKLSTGRDFNISQPISRESHQIIISKELTKIFRKKTESNRLGICVPPRCGKSVMLSLWVAWCYASYPDSNFIYISYSHDLAAKHTDFIKRVMLLKHYEYLFDVSIRKDSRARDRFMTTAGGSCAAFGSGGAIVGQDAGLPNLDRFAGSVIIDDPHKIDEAHSATIRGKVLSNYEETIRQRAPEGTPIVFIGQRTHEDDLAAFLQSDKDIVSWDWIILPGLDEAKNSIDPSLYPKETLLKMKEKSPYVFASQMQQVPVPAGGSVFKEDWFPILEEEPDIYYTFITADTAETKESYNDATVFSFWGVYEIENMGRKTGVLALHWLDCEEIRVEPKDLEPEFKGFYSMCCTHKVQPRLAAIEKKSTGVTLVSTLESIRGLEIRKIERTRASGSKTQRFLNAQSFVASKLISFPKYGKHNKMCIDHMCKITANDTHRFDDICDTAVDAIHLALIDKTIYHGNYLDKKKSLASEMAQSFENKRHKGMFRHG